MTLTTTTLSGNSAPTGPEIDGGYSGANNRIGGVDPAEVFAAVVVVDPDDGPKRENSCTAGARADNGGPVPTSALRADLANPALDAGDDTALVASKARLDFNGDGGLDATIDTDARGLPRFVDRPGIGNGGAGIVDRGEVTVTVAAGTPETLTGTNADLIDDGLLIPA